jgi:chromate transporter
MLPLNLLFIRFLKLGATAYGGPAIAGQMKKTIVKDLGCLTETEFLQWLALCQLIPGATFVQMSSYIGYRLRGIWGAFICALAFIIPAFILIITLSAIYFTLGNLWFIKSLFKGRGGNGGRHRAQCRYQFRETSRERMEDGLDRHSFFCQLPSDP